MRSILKHPHLPNLPYQQQCPEPFPFATCATVEVSPHVHFPPTPTLTSIFITHSSSVYDRRPAEVLPNVCALPGRHEREVVDTSSCSRPARHPWNEDPKASYFDPRTSEASELSESDDSDAIRTPPDPMMPSRPIAVRFGYRNAGDVMLPYSPTQEEIESALLFLPHDPSIPLKKDTRRSDSLGRTRRKEPRRPSADGRIQHHSGFTVPTLDFEGCLGGF